MNKTDCSQSDSAIEVNDLYDPATVIARSPLFDENWYLSATLSAKSSVFDPAYHYYHIGARMGRNPGPAFDTLGYLLAHPDVAEAGINPLLHFEKYGRNEGRQTPAPNSARTSIPQSIAASTLSPRGWRMMPQEAERVLSTTLVPWHEASEPRRILPTFDTMAARRYTAAAAALYDPECAALKASIITPTYNRSAQLIDAIRSVLNQSHHNLELLVVDDGSTDDTSVRLSQFAADQRVRVFWNNHGGVSAARNTGLENATGDYVFYLDSDNTWTPDYLMLMLAGLRATGADCAYSASCIISEADELVGFRGEPFDWEACLSRNYVDMNVFAHRIGMARELGGFDTDLRRVVDWDLILRYTKNRDVAFFPFIGCKYHDDRRDHTRITNAQPKLYRRIVIEKNRLDLRSGAEAIDAMSLSFGIKIAAPHGKREEWGDFHYAESLAEALTRLGHTARIDFRGKWSEPWTRDDDVALILRGHDGYKPPRNQLTLMWIISHPDQVPYDEYANYNQVLVASRSYAALLSMILDRPVYPLLQCTDTGRFHLPDGTRPLSRDTRGLFVGNSRNEYRQMVRWSIENDVDVDIYGARWDQFIPGERVAGENVPNTRLGEKYRVARFVLNDHWPSMKEFGFVSNRVFDVVASGGRLISDRLPSLEAIFGEAVEIVDDETAFLEAVSQPSLSPERCREAAEYVQTHHSFDARAKAVQAVVKSALTPTPCEVTAELNFAPSVARRTAGLLVQQGRAGWISSAYIRLISPLTTDHAYSIAGLDLVALDGPGDPRLETCDICIAQGIAVPDPDDARRLIAALRAQGVPLYVDTDEAFFMHGDHLVADKALRLLMKAASEVWFSTETLAELYRDVATGKARVRRDELDPRLWRDYRKPASTAFGEGPVRIVHMGTEMHQDDLEIVMPAFERLARDYPGRFDLTLVSATSTPPEADWLSTIDSPSGYPAFARFAARELVFDVGIAPFVPSSFDAARSDIKFLNYSAMGLLSIVSQGPVYQDCIDAELAMGCGATQEAWYEVLAEIIERRADFVPMRRRAAEYVWRERNLLANPFPLADLLRGGAHDGRHPAGSVHRCGSSAVGGKQK